MSLKRRLREWVTPTLNRHNFISTPQQFNEHQTAATAVRARHDHQTLADVEALRAKYREPIFGDTQVWDLLVRMGEIIDVSDPWLGSTSQLAHTLQMVEAMEDNGWDDEDMIVTALIHDLGKLLMLVGEAPENVFCMIEPIGEYDDGIGLDNCTFQWNHDEFVWSRFNGHVKPVMAWVLRYHSIYPDKIAHLMTPEEREWTETILKPFQHFDQDFKSPYHAPNRKLDQYRDLISARFPDPIPF